MLAWWGSCLDGAYQRIFGHWVPGLSCSYIGLFTHHKQCLPAADLFIPGTGVLGQHVQPHSDALDGYYQQGHWDICGGRGGGGV